MTAAARPGKNVKTVLSYYLLSRVDPLRPFAFPSGLTIKIYLIRLKIPPTFLPPGTPLFFCLLGIRTPVYTLPLSILRAIEFNYHILCRFHLHPVSVCGRKCERQTTTGSNSQLIDSDKVTQHYCKTYFASRVKDEKYMTSGDARVHV